MSLFCVQGTVVVKSFTLVLADSPEDALLIAAERATFVEWHEPARDEITGAELPVPTSLTHWHMTGAVDPPRGLRVELISRPEAAPTKTDGEY